MSTVPSVPEILCPLVGCEHEDLMVGAIYEGPLPVERTGQNRCELWISRDWVQEIEYPISFTDSWGKRGRPILPGEEPPRSISFIDPADSAYLCTVCSGRYGASSRGNAFTRLRFVPPEERVWVYHLHNGYHAP